MNYVLSLSDNERNILEVRTGANPDDSVVVYHKIENEWQKCAEVLSPEEFLSLLQEQTPATTVDLGEGFFLLQIPNGGTHLEVLAPNEHSIEQLFSLRVKHIPDGDPDVGEWEKASPYTFSELVGVISRYF